MTTSAAVPVTVTNDVPAAPSSLAVTGVTRNSVSLQWVDNPGNETGFRILRSTNGTNFSVIGAVGADVTTFTDTGHRSNRTFHYRVRAYNANGNSANSNTVTATTLP